jgi:hypothetical protein
MLTFRVAKLRNRNFSVNVEKSDYTEVNFDLGVAGDHFLLAIINYRGDRGCLGQNN